MGKRVAGFPMQYTAKLFGGALVVPLQVKHLAILAANLRGSGVESQCLFHQRTGTAKVSDSQL